MTTFEKLSLKSNPFRVTPTSNENELVWAGFHDVKQVGKPMLQNIFLKSLY